MIEEAGKRHEHRGRSSRGILEPDRILKEMDLKGGDRLLDAGCGDGYFSIAASPMVGEEGRVYAVDSDGVAIAELRSRLAGLRITNLEAHVADLSKGLPLADMSVNSVLLANVLHGLVANGEADAALREMARVVSPGGKLSVVEFKRMEMPMGPPLSIRLSPERVEELMVKYGFRKEKVIEAGPYHYQMVLVRDGDDFLSASAGRDPDESKVGWLMEAIALIISCHSTSHPFAPFEIISLECLMKEWFSVRCRREALTLNYPLRTCIHIQVWAAGKCNQGHAHLFGHPHG